jgi:inner membrane protein
MVTVFTHAFSAIGIGMLLPRSALPRRAWIGGALLAAAPDLDAIGHWSGVPYSHLFGHRGFSHSPACALLVAALATVAVSARRPSPSRRKPWTLFAYLALCMASHGLLDALTNGGLGVAFLAPFSEQRFFLPWTPIEVAPLSVHAFFSQWGLEVVLSELFWVWLPGIALMITALAIRRARAGR